jgi:hypothetical protein
MTAETFALNVFSQESPGFISRNRGGFSHAFDSRTFRGSNAKQRKPKG